MRLDYPPLEGPPVCTAKLATGGVARRPQRAAPDPASYFRTRVKPTHRALDDAMACAEVFDGLLDMGGASILTLGDLREAVRARGRPHYGKIRLADALPHTAGVYRFLGRDGGVLYVGKARDLRARVKSYFYGDERKKIENLLGEVRHVEGEETPGGELEALVLEAWPIRRPRAEVQPPRQDVASDGLREARPVRGIPSAEGGPPAAAEDGCVYRAVLREQRRPAGQGGAEEIVPLRRCTRAMGARGSPAPRARRHRAVPRAVRRQRRPRALRRARPGPPLLLRSPDGLLGALEARMTTLAEADGSRRRLRSATGSAPWRPRSIASGRIAGCSGPAG